MMGYWESKTEHLEFSKIKKTKLTRPRACVKMTKEEAAQELPPSFQGRSMLAIAPEGEEP